MDTLVETEKEDSVLELLSNPDRLEQNGHGEVAELLRSLDDDDRFGYMVSYAKLDVNPEEMYLWMRVNAGIATPKKRKEPGSFMKPKKKDMQQCLRQPGS